MFGEFSLKVVLLGEEFCRAVRGRGLKAGKEELTRAEGGARGTEQGVLKTDGAEIAFLRAKKAAAREESGFLTAKRVKNEVPSAPKGNKMQSNG